VHGVGGLIIATFMAGMVHSVSLLLIMLFLGKWAALIPMATLSGILIVVAWHMSEGRSFVSVLKGPKDDAAILLTTFILTVLVDLTVAIEMGMILAAFLFMRQMIRTSAVKKMGKQNGNNGEQEDGDELDGNADILLPEGVEMFEIAGPLFFGAAYKFRDAMRFIEKPPRVLIIRMRQVPVIDATGVRVIGDVYKESKRRGTRLILSEVHSAKVREELGKARLLFAIGKANVTETFGQTLERCGKLLEEEKGK
jgi:SulP family sulfate permease